MLVCARARGCAGCFCVSTLKKIMLVCVRARGCAGCFCFLFFLFVIFVFLFAFCFLLLAVYFLLFTFYFLLFVFCFCFLLFDQVSNFPIRSHVNEVKLAVGLTEDTPGVDVFAKVRMMKDNF